MKENETMIKKYIDMNILLLDVESIPSIPGKPLDPRMALDVVKYALVMGIPLKPSKTP